MVPSAELHRAFSLEVRRKVVELNDWDDCVQFGRSGDPIVSWKGGNVTRREEESEREMRRKH